MNTKPISKNSLFMIEFRAKFAIPCYINQGEETSRAILIRQDGKKILWNLPEGVFVRVQEGIWILSEGSWRLCPTQELAESFYPTAHPAEDLPEEIWDDFNLLIFNSPQEAHPHHIQKASRMEELRREIYRTSEACKILMERDGTNEEEAVQLLIETMNVFCSPNFEGDREEFFMDELGLEPDYILELLY